MNLKEASLSTLAYASGVSSFMASGQWVSKYFSCTGSPRSFFPPGEVVFPEQFFLSYIATVN